MSKHIVEMRPGDVVQLVAPDDKALAELLDNNIGVGSGEAIHEAIGFHVVATVASVHGYDGGHDSDGYFRVEFTRVKFNRGLVADNMYSRWLRPHVDMLGVSDE